MEKPPFVPETGEAEPEPIRPEQLRDACLDLRLAIRKQVKKARAGHRGQLQVWANRTKTANMSADAYIMKMGQQKHLPTATQIRERLRQTHRIPAGTETIDGHLIQHFYGIFEDEQSARLPNNHPESHLVVTHITKKINRLQGLIEMSPIAMEQSEVESTLYTIDINGEAMSVSQGARLLEPSELNLPFDIVTQALDLYPKPPKR